MSLEQHLAKNNDLLEKQNDLLSQLLGQYAANTGGKVSEKAADKPAADKPAADKKEKADKKSDEITYDELEGKLRPWLGEFPKAHPETAARRAKFKELLGKLDAKALKEIADDSDKLGRLDAWFEGKGKTWDEGHGIGRFAPDPEEDESDDGDL